MPVVFVSESENGQDQWVCQRGEEGGRESESEKGPYVNAVALRSHVHPLPSRSRPAHRSAGTTSGVSVTEQEATAPTTGITAEADVSVGCSLSRGIWQLPYNRNVTLRRVTFWVDEDLADALKVIKERDGIPEAEQLRRAIRTWVEGKHVLVRQPAGSPRTRPTGRTQKRR